MRIGLVFSAVTGAFSILQLQLMTVFTKVVLTFPLTPASPPAQGHFFIGREKRRIFFY